MKYQKLELLERKPTDPGVIEADRLLSVSETNGPVEGNCMALQDRQDGEFEGKSFYLSKSYDWVIGEDNEDSIVLIPLRKKR